MSERNSYRIYCWICTPKALVHEEHLVLRRDGLGLYIMIVRNRVPVCKQLIRGRHALGDWLQYQNSLTDIMNCVIMHY